MDHAWLYRPCVRCGHTRAEHDLGCTADGCACAGVERADPAA